MTSPLRTGFGLNVDDGSADAFIEKATAAGMGSLRRGWESGRVGNELNPLYTDELEAGTAGDEGKRAALRAQIEALKQKQSIYAPEVGRVEDIKGSVGNGLSWLGGQVGQGAASMADPMAVSAGLGTVGRIASHLPGPGKALGYAAQGAGMLTPALMSKQQLTGEFIGNAEQDQELMARTSKQGLRDMAGDYGSLAAIPDSFLPGMVGRQISGLSRAGSQAARQGAMGAGAKTAFGMGVEGGTEAGQSMGSQYAQGVLNPNRDTSGDFMENVNSFAGGAVGAGPFTAAGALAEAGHNRIDGGVDAVKNKAGEIIDTFNDDPHVQAGKAAVGKMAGKAKGDVIDLLADEDGDVTVGGVVGKVSDQIAKYKRSAEELDLLANDTPPVGLDEAKTAAWFDQNDAKRDAYVQSTLAGMTDDPEAQAALQAGDMTAGAEFLLARHDLTQIKAKLAGRTQRLAEGTGSVVATIAKGAFGIAKDVASGVMQGIGKKNFQTDESGQQGGNVDDPYLQWQERVGFPSTKGTSDTAAGKTDGMRTAAEEQSRRRATLFGHKLANAAKVAGQEDLAEPMQDIGFQIADMSRGWANLDKAKDAAGMKLAIGEIGNDLRSVFGHQAAAVIGEMERISNPEHAELFQLLKEEAVRSGTPEGRALREQLRSTAADKLLMLLPKAHYDEATKTPKGKMKLLEQIEQLSTGGYPKATREEVEKVYGRSRLNAMFNIVGGLTTDIEQGGEEPTTGPVDALAEKEGLDAMDKTRGNDIYGFRGNLGDRSRADHPDVFKASSKLGDDVEEGDDGFNRPQLFRTTADAKGNVIGTQVWGKGTRSEGKTQLSTKIAEMKAKVDNTHEVAEDGTESGETNGWDVQARSAHDIMNDQGMSPQKRLQLYRTYLRQDTRTNEGSSAEDRAHADKTRPEFRAVNELISEIVARQGKASKPESEWTNEDTAAWQKQLTRATKNGYKGEDTSPAALDRFEVERLMPQVDAYFKSHHMVVARNQQDNNEQKLGVDKVLKMKEKGKKLADRVGYDATLAKVDGGQAAADQVVSDANILMFPTQARDKDGNRVFKKDKSGKDVPVPGDDLPIRASDLVLWAKSTNASNGQTQDVQEEKDSPAKLNRRYLEHLLAGISAFVGEGHAIGMPYKMNGGGEQESFADSNIPQSLRLDNAVYAEALDQPGFRLTNKSVLKNKGSLARVGPNKIGPEDIRSRASNQREVRRDQGRNDEFFTVEDREDRDMVVDERDGAGVRRYTMTQGERDTWTALKTSAKRQEYIAQLKEEHGPEWAAAFDADGPQGAQYASSQSDGMVTRQGRTDGWEATGRMNEEARGTSTRMRVDVSGKIAADPKGEGAPLDYTRGQDQKAEWDENSDLAYRTSVLNADFKEPTNAMKAMTSAKYNAEALTAMTMNDPREGDRMAITMLRSALKPTSGVRGKSFDPYRIAPLVHLVANNKETEGKDKFAALTNAEYFQQAGATPELINILRRGSMQVLIREMGAREPSMTEAHILKLARQLPGVGTNANSHNVMAKLQAALVSEGGPVTAEDMATNWGDPSKRKVQPKMSPPPVVAKPGAARQAVKTADAERMAAQAGKPSGRQAWELDEDEMGAGLDAMVETAEMKAQRINSTAKAWGASDAANDALRKRTDPEEAARLARNATGGRPGLEQHRAKDKLKAAKANKFIGRGSEASSTNKYAQEWGDKANTGVYSKSDVVFISAEGNRAGRITPDTAEIKRATSAGATIITDVKADRDRDYNVGERRVAYILVDAGYVESAPGTWTPGNTKPAPGVATSAPGKPQSGGVKRNAMAVAIHNDLGRSGFGATHDSPKPHEGKFDWRTHSGSGEGNAAFGAGTYLSTADGVHEAYKKAFTAIVEDSNPANSETYRGLKELLDHAKDHPGYLTPEDTADIERQIKYIEKKWVRTPTGKSPTYEVSVNINPEQLLDWDAPLSEQSELVRKALKAQTDGSVLEFDYDDGAWSAYGEGEVMYTISDQYGASALEVDGEYHGEYEYLEDAIGAARSLARDPTTKGKDAYNALADARGSQAAASDYLQSLGILGHKYNSKAGKNDTHPNYVIYDDSKITTNYVHFNKQGKAQGAHEGWKSGPTASAATQAEMDAAKSWLDKVLPGTVLKFVDEAGWSGEYIEAQNLINISKTAAAGIMGTVYHEGLHKFFGQLIKGNPKLLAKMNGFVNDPKVMARLNELLADYPAAQAQLVDGEERLAYAFQFWKAGLLQVDVTPQGFFQSVGALFRRILGHMRDSEHALAIFSAFDKGELANPSTAGTIIAKQLSKGTGALKTRRQLDKFVQGLAAGVLPTEMILGNSVSSTARKLGKILFTNPGDEKAGGGQTGYLNAKRASGRSFDNRAKQFIENMSDSDVKAVQEFMQKGTPLDQIKASEHRAAVEGMRNLLDEFHKYMVAGGLKIGKIKDYYPTVWNVDKLIQNKAGFIKMLVNNYAQQMNPEGGNAHKAAERIHASLVDRQGVDQALTATREDGVLSPFFASQEGRTLSFLSGEHKAEFLEKNMTNTLSQYFHQGARATEYNRRFGEHGVLLERMLKDVRTELTGASKEMMARDEFKDDQARKDWLARQVRDVTMSVGAIEGTLGANISPNMRKFNSWMAVYQNIRLLPMALFSSFVDPLAQVARGAPLASAYETFMTGIKAVYQAWAAAFSDLPPSRVKSEWEKLAEFIGVTEVAAFTHHVAEEYASVYMSPAAKKINDFMFRFNGMEAWDRSNRVMATKWAVRFIEKHAALPDKHHSARWLEELGLKAGSIPLNADGELITSKEELAIVKGLNAGEAARQMQTVHNAIARWVEGAVITPNSAQRPAWSSDPNYSVFFHLKQFSYSFQQTIMKRAVNEVQHGNLAPVGTLAMFIPTMITSDIIKGLIQGGGTLPPYMAGFTAGDWMIHGLQRSGLAGVGDIGMGASADLSSLGGPAVEQAADALRDDAGRSIMKAMPAHALYEYMIKGGTTAAVAV